MYLYYLYCGSVDSNCVVYGIYTVLQYHMHIIICVSATANGKTANNFNEKNTNKMRRGAVDISRVVDRVGVVDGGKSSDSSSGL